MERLNQYTSSKYLMQLTWPIFIELLLQILVGNVDQFMIGRYSQTAVGAIGNANQIINVLILTFSVISLATTILVSQYIGAGKGEQVGQIYTLSLFVNTVFSVIVSILLLLFSKQIFGWMGLPAELLPQAQLYIQIIGSCMFLQAIFLTFSAIFRSNALARETMFVSIVINLVNIGGNALLLRGFGIVPPLGIIGVAVATNVSKLVGVILLLYFYHKRIGVRISARHLHPFPFSLLRRLLLIGVPSGGESLSYNFTQIIIQTFVNRFGTFVINAKVYCNMFATLSYVFATAIAQASQIIVGYLMGAGEITATHQRVMKTLKLSILITVGMAVLLFLLSGPLIGFFTDNPEVISLGQKIMAIEIVLEFGRAINVVLVRALQATGDINFPILVGIASVWTFAVGLGYLLGVVCNLGLVGIWTGMAIEECVRGAIFLMRWKRGKWKTKHLIEAQ